MSSQTAGHKARGSTQTLFIAACLVVACTGDDQDASLVIPEAAPATETDGGAAKDMGHECTFSETALPQDTVVAPTSTDYLIITADQLADAAQNHAEYRRNQGHRAEVLTMGEVLAQLDESDASQNAAVLNRLRGEIEQREALLEGEHPLFVLLLGDTSTGINAEEVPTGTTRGWLWNNGTQDVTSDNVLADLDGDDLPDVALGRIPVTTHDAAEAILERTRQAEEAHLPGAWNGRVHLFAGQGGFGSFADAMLEQAGFAIVDEVPMRWQVSFTNARPGSDYTYPPAQFSDHVYDLINSGSLATAYLGHGRVERFADILWDNERAPILETNDLHKLDIQGHSPLLLFMACWTGAFDLGESLSERMFAQAGGPVSIFASTEVSHPYASGIITREIAVTMFNQQLPTVGEVILESKRRMETAAQDEIRAELDSYAVLDPRTSSLEQREDMLRQHQHMFTLMGDPGRRINYPQGTVDIEILPPKEGSTRQVRACVHVRGVAAGHALVTLESDRESIHHQLAPWDQSQTDRDEIIVANHALANDKAIARWEGAYKDGGFAVSLPHDSVEGTYYLRVYAEDGQVDAIGSHPVAIKR
jgi:hypothetical protein